jgi:hypothetical protein
LKPALFGVQRSEQSLEGMEKLPGAKGADPRRFVDFTILGELEKEGFVKNLFKN